MKFIQIENDNAHEFDDNVDKRPSLVRFHSPHCGWCRMMHPQWVALRENGKLKNKDMNVIDVNTGVLHKLNKPCVANAMSQGVPYIVMVDKEGNVTNEYNGDRSTDDMAEFAVKNMDDKKEMKGGKKAKKHMRKTRKHVKKAKKHATKSRKHMKKSRKHLKKAKKHATKSRKHMKK